MSKQTLKITVKSDGTRRFIYSDELAGLIARNGEAKVTRASSVEPHPNGGWTADLAPVGGPVLGPFPLRELALAAEVEWLDRNLFA